MPVYSAAVRFTYSGPGSPGYNIWHFRTLGTVLDQAAVDDAVENLVTFYQAIRLWYPSSVTMQVPELVTRIDTTPPEATPATVTTVTGGGGSAELPERLAVLVKLQAARPGRSGRGRKFLGPCIENTNELNGTVDEDARAAIQAALDSFIASSTNDNGWSYGVWSTQSQTLSDLVTGSVDNEWAQLSSRRF